MRCFFCSININSISDSIVLGRFVSGAVLGTLGAEFNSSNDLLSFSGFLFVLAAWASFRGLSSQIKPMPPALVAQSLNH